MFALLLLLAAAATGILSGNQFAGSYTMHRLSHYRAFQASAPFLAVQIFI